MKAVSAAYRARSLQAFQETLDAHRAQLVDDPLVNTHLTVRRECRYLPSVHEIILWALRFRVFIDTPCMSTTLSISCGGGKVSLLPRGSHTLSCTVMRNSRNPHFHVSSMRSIGCGACLHVL